MAARTAVVASDIPAFRSVARTVDVRRCSRTGIRSHLADALRVALERGPAVLEKLEAGVRWADENSMAAQAGVYLDMYRRQLSAGPSPIHERSRL